MFKCLVALTALFPAAVLAATVWTWVDENGQRHYSDREVPGATQIEITETQTFSGAALRSALPAEPAPAEPAPILAEPVGYEILDVISPEPEQTFWNIAGNLPVVIGTFPALAPEHYLDVTVDGERKGLAARSLELTVPEVWRGEHTLQALIIDSDGQIVMQSSPVTFFVQQTSIAN